MKKAVTLSALAFFFLCPGIVRAAEMEVVQSTAPAGQAVETPAPAQARSINTAISELNYKIEVIQGRYNSLGKDIEDLRKADRDQRQSISELGFQRPTAERIERMESELDLLRNDLAQCRENISFLKSGGKGTPPEQEEKKPWSFIYEPWVAPASLGISILALLIAL
jgi:TolA-binding protein